MLKNNQLGLLHKLLSVVHGIAARQLQLGAPASASRTRVTDHIGCTDQPSSDRAAHSAPETDFNRKLRHLARLRAGLW